MSDYEPYQSPELAYESSLPGRISGLRQGTWISLLVLGILSILGGLCMGGLMGIGIYALSSGAGMRGGGAPRPVLTGSMATIVWLMAAGFLVLPTVMGTAEIICSVKVRGGSKAAGITAAVLVGLQILGALAIMGLRLVNAARFGLGRQPVGFFVAGLVFYGAMAMVLAVMEVLLLRVIRERGPQPG